MANDEKKVGIKFTNSITGQEKLEKYANNLERIQSFTKGIDTGVLKKLNESKGIEKTSKNIEGIGKKVKIAFNVSAISAFISKTKTLVQTIGKLTDMSAEYTENLNLYQVAFDGATEGADKFINKLSEMYGLDESWLVRTTGVFKQLSNAMNLGVEQGTKLSALMTQMAIDISSLYNIDIERASSVLQSSLAGQTKPIRGATGGDITQATLQSTLDSLGIDRAISQLSYAEKRLVIIISLTQQLRQVTNDFGKTIESPANQMRILNEQWTRLSRAVGNLFLPILAKILPYLNAIVMTLTEIINLIAGLFGFKIDDFNYGVGSVSDSVLELEDSLNGASAGASDLKKELSGLRSFDKLNVIKTPNDSGNAGLGSGGTSGLNIDPQIMEAFNSAFEDYNSRLTDVQMKATRVRDLIMEWLGFTKIINEETNEVNWLYEGTSSKIGEILQTLMTSGASVANLFGTIAGYIIRISTTPLATEIFENVYNILINIIEVIGNVANAWNEAFESNDKGFSIIKSYYGMVNTVLKIVNSISNSLKKWTISSSFKSAINSLVDIFNDVLAIIVNIAEWIQELYITYLAPVVDDILVLISETIVAIGSIWDVVEPLVMSIIEILEGFLGPVIGNIITLIENVINILTSLMQFVSSVFKLDWENAWNSIKNIFSGVVDYILNSGKIITGYFDNLWKAIQNIFMNVGTWFKNVFKSAWDGVTSIWKNAGNWFEKNVLNPIKNVFTNTFNGIKNTISNIWDEILGLFNKGGKIFDGIVGGIADVFKTIVNALIDGINRVIAIPFNTINGLLNTIRNASFLGIAPFQELWSENPLYVPKIPKLEKGGLPEVGQLFVANERGPELVGHIGGQSFVANQNQMMELLDKKIGNANSGINNVTFVIQVGDEEVARKVLTNLQDMAKSNGETITIG